MKDDWVGSEWRELCQRLIRCAEIRDLQDIPETTNHRQLAEQFAQQESPQGYSELLQRVSEAATLAISWQHATDRIDEKSDSTAVEIEFDLVQEAGEDSFPASDPPAWSSATV